MDDSGVEDPDYVCLSEPGKQPLGLFSMISILIANTVETNSFTMIPKKQTQR